MVGASNQMISMMWKYVGDRNKPPRYEVVYKAVIVSQSQREGRWGVSVVAGFLEDVV